MNREKTKNGNKILKMLEESIELCYVKPLFFIDEDIQDKIYIRTSDYYFMITINKRTYYFVRKTGEYDGYDDAYYDFPTLAYDSSSEGVRE